MAGLLDLPHEVILIIVEYLQADIQHVAMPFYELGDAHRYAINHNSPRRIGYMRSLLLVSRRILGRAVDTVKGAVQGNVPDINSIRELSMEELAECEYSSLMVCMDSY